MALLYSEDQNYFNVLNGNNLVPIKKNVIDERMFNQISALPRVPREIQQYFDVPSSATPQMGDYLAKGAGQFLQLYGMASGAAEKAPSGLSGPALQQKLATDAPSGLSGPALQQKLATDAPWGLSGAALRRSLGMK